MQINAKEHPILKQWLEQNELTHLFDQPIEVELEEVQRLEEECKKSHPNYTPEECFAWAVYSIVARTPVSRDEQSELGRERTSAVTRTAVSLEKQSKEFRRMLDALDAYRVGYEANAKVIEASAGVIEAATQRVATATEVLPKAMSVVVANLGEYIHEASASAAAAANKDETENRTVVRETGRTIAEAVDTHGKAVDAAGRVVDVRLEELAGAVRMGSASLCKEISVATTLAVRGASILSERMRAIEEEIKLQGIEAKSRYRWNWVWRILILLALGLLIGVQSAHSQTIYRPMKYRPGVLRFTATLPLFTQDPAGGTRDPAGQNLSFRWKDEGTTIFTHTSGLININCTGTGLTCTWTAATRTITIDGSGGGGGGTTVTVNGSALAASTGDLDDTTPAAPANALNIKWQKDALSPTNISGYVPTFASSVLAGLLTDENGTTGLFPRVDFTGAATNDLLCVTNAATPTNGLCAVTYTFVDNVFRVCDNGDCTKLWGLDLVNIPTLTTRIWTLNADGSLPPAHGGTGAITLTGLLQGNGTSTVTTVTNSSTVGQILRVTGASTYAWGALDLADTDAVTGLLPDANIAASIARDSEITLTNLGGGTAGANSYDFSGATAIIVKQGTAAPASTACDAAGEVGSLYVQSGNPATVNLQAFRCTQTGASTYAWHPVSHFVGTTLPTTCMDGAVAYDSDATSGQRWYACESGTWVQQGGAGGGAHDILSATHGDTTAAAVERGAGMFGIGSTPKWAKVTTTTTDRYFKRNSSGDIVESSSAAAGTGSCTNQFVRANNADASPTCASVATADISNDQVTRDKVASNLRTDQFVLLMGADNGVVIVDGDDQAKMWVNDTGYAITITQVKCYCDAGSPIVNFQRDDGSAANILSSNLTVSSSGATGTIDTNEDNVASGDKINWVTVTAGGTAKYIVCTFRYTVD